MEMKCVQGQVEMADSPEWLLDKIQANNDVATLAEPVSDRIPDGSRNSTLASLAGSMRRRGMSAAEIKAALLVANTDRCNPPLAEEEVLRIAESIASYVPGDPPKLSINGQQSKLSSSLPANTIGSTWENIREVLGPIEWDWRQWLVKAMLILVASSPGVGKSMLMLRIVASYIMGWPWPDGQPFQGETGSVIWCEAEAAQAINLERAEAMCLPLDKILTPLDNPLIDIRLDNYDHWASFVAMAQRPDVRLIVVDSLRGVHSKDENSSETIEIVMLLAELARDSGIPVLVSHHLRKRNTFDGDEVSLERLRGSSAIVQPSRLVWALDAPDPSDLEHKRLSVIKSNLARFPEPIGLRIDENGIKFDRAPEPPKNETQTDQAADVLLAILKKEPLKATIVREEVEQAGVSWSTAKRAKKRLGIKAIKKGKVWFWSLPSKELRVS